MATDWQERVINEAKELRIKHEALYNFLYRSDKIYDLHLSDVRLMEQQEEVMFEYLQILEQRIAKF